MKKVYTYTFLALYLCTSVLTLFAQDRYMEPPKEIAALMMVPPLPETSFSNNYKKYAIVESSTPMNDITYIADFEYKIAGIRIHPANFTASRLSFSSSIRLADVATGNIVDVVGMPNNAQITSVKWSPTDKYLCFLHHTPHELELWRIEVAAAKAQKINSYPLNAVLCGNNAYDFLDDERILYLSVPDGVGAIPEPPAVPTGPVIQESYGKTNKLYTYTDLLTSYYDEQLFDYFATVQFAVFSPQGSTRIGPKAIVKSFTLSPNGNYMMVSTEHKPYSYQQAHSDFPGKLEMWDTKGNLIQLLQDNTKENEEEASAKERSSKEPRKSDYAWRADMPAVLVWTEQAANNQTEEEKKEAPEQKYTTAVYQLQAPFDGEKQLVIRPEYKIGTILWGNSKFAVYTETSTKQKVKNTLSFVPADTTKAPVLLYSESTEVDSLGVFPVIGSPHMVKNSYGANVVFVDDKLSYIYLTYINRFTLDHGTRKDSGGDNMFFIDRFDLKTKKAVNLWTGKAPYNESVVAITDFKNLKFISLRQSVKEVPNYYIIDPKANKMQQITFYTDPCPALRAIQKQLVTYTRKDGVPLTAMLYLPADYDQERDGKLPVYMWGYPRDYKCVADALKDRPSRYLFNVSHYFYIVTQGYAVLDFSAPIIATNTKQPANDVFREQLIMNAEAAINYIDSVGIGDRNRVGVCGHSYGAFMTATLLAHTKLFKAGIARSGAYNRTLTHNGFQGEQRTYWKAPQFYYEMSPFSYANQIKTPILLIHGQMDNNSGTFPIQSERLYHALIGLGGNVRYVQLPYESHGYSAKESQLHVMYEVITFMDKHVKNAKP